jgi:hypothetical protein
MAQPNPPELSDRDWGVLRDLLRVRLLTGQQIERLRFAELASPNVRGSVRRRSLGRLVSAGLVTTLPRRVGGARAGSAGLVYALDTRGRRLLVETANRVRRPWPVGWPFVKHTLDVAELYVRQIERETRGDIKLIEFVTEPASWFPAGRAFIKPDAWTVYETEAWERHVWLEVDRGTESLPTIERKLRGYIEFTRSGRPGPLGVIPRVLVTVPDAHRLTAIYTVLTALPDPASELITVQFFHDVFGTAARPPP